MEKNIRKNFIYPKLSKTTYKFGSNKFPSVILNKSGDWRDFRPLEEYQNKNGVETSACYIYAQTHAIATIMEKQYNLPDQDFSDRFNALLSNGTEYGGDPIEGAESMRKHDGIIPDYLLPFVEGIKNWDDYHSFKFGDESTCRAAGRDFLSKWKINYDIVFEMNDNLEDKFTKLKQALLYSPCPISVYGSIDLGGNYIEKPHGMNDTHLTLAVCVDDDNSIWVFDTYSPFIKKLPANYNSDFCMRWSISKIEKLDIKKTSIWNIICEWLRKNKLIYREFKIFNIENKKIKCPSIS